MPETGIYSMTFAQFVLLESSEPKPRLKIKVKPTEFIWVKNPTTGEYYDKAVTFTAYHQRHIVGRLVISSHSNPPSVFKVAVNPGARRQGVATALYRAAEEVWGELTPSKALHDDGFYFWKGYRPDAVKEDLRNHKEILLGKDVTLKDGRTGTISDVGSRSVTVNIHGSKFTTVISKDEVMAQIPLQESTDQYPVVRFDPTQTPPSNGWLSKGGTHWIKCYRHAEPAREITGVDQDNAAVNAMYSLGWLRVVSPAGRMIYVNTYDRLDPRDYPGAFRNLRDWVLFFDKVLYVDGSPMYFPED